MHLKRYRGNSVREALAMARHELGPAALVLSTRLVAAHGLRGLLGSRVVEVTAASDREMSESRPTNDVSRQAHTPATDPHGARDDVSGGRRGGARAAAGWKDGIVARLCATGLDRALAAEVADGFPRWRGRNVPLRTLRHAVAHRIDDLAAGGEDYAPIEVFVGPPGVGKTTTIAKIAAQERVRRGARLTLVAADGFRVGAVEQLRLYAEIIGAPFAVARTPAELDEALTAARGPVLVDTAGRSPRDASASALFDVLARRTGARTHLVLPAATARREAERVIESFSAAVPSRVVLTRVDETESVGAVVGLLRDRGLRASYLGTGQRVPEDLERATAGVLAAHVLGEYAGAPA